jgi:NAD+ kinase
VTDRTVGVVVHAGRESSIETAAAAARGLEKRGLGVLVADNAEVPGGGDGLADVGPVVASEDLAGKVDLVMSFGGDGTFLRAAHLCREAGVPVLGVNLGRLGFLAEVEREDLEIALDTVAADAFVTDQRPTLDMQAQDAHGTVLGSDWALNEVSIEKSVRQRLLRMDVSFGGRLFAHVPADALVVASSTGSTAYALSAGGPIVDPRIDAMLVVPVAPHSLFDRTVVAAPDDVVDVTIAHDQPSAIVSCDGRPPLDLGPGARVRVTGGGQPVVIARLAPLDFYELVRRKFGLR